VMGGSPTPALGPVVARSVAEHSVVLLGLSQINWQPTQLGRHRPGHLATGDCFGAGAIAQFHLSKDEQTNAHAPQSEPANPTRVLEVEAAGQMPILRRGARNLRA
jgi:hypothetical protein